MTTYQCHKCGNTPCILQVEEGSDAPENCPYNEIKANWVKKEDQMKIDQRFVDMAIVMTDNNNSDANEVLYVSRKLQEVHDEALESLNEWKADFNTLKKHSDEQQKRIERSVEVLKNVHTMQTTRIFEALQILQGEGKG